jgi:hypothetical protein
MKIKLNEIDSITIELVNGGKFEIRAGRKPDSIFVTGGRNDDGDKRLVMLNGEGSFTFETVMLQLRDD